MSQIINALKEVFSRKDDGLLHKEIIDTFFEKSSRNTKKLPRKRKPNPIFLASVAVLIIAIFSGIVIVYIRGVKHGSFEEGAAYYRKDIIKKGVLNRDYVEDIYFDGDAKDKSSFAKNSVILVNSGNYGRASLVMTLRDGTDLEGSSLLITAKAERGIRKIDVILKDSQNHFYEYSNLLFSPNWDLRHIYLNRKDNFDLKNVKQMKIEFGSFTTGNQQNSVLHIKDMVVRRARL